MLMAAPDLLKKLLSCVVAIMIAFPVTAMAVFTPLSVGERIANVKMMVSHTAKGQANSTTLAYVEQTLERAEAALKKNNLEEADSLCTRAWEIYKTAIKSVQEKTHKEKDEKSLATITTSANALLKQAEKMSQANKGKNSGQIKEAKTLLAQAAATKDPVRARIIVNQSYTLLKSAMKDMRGESEKVVQDDRNFATPELKFADELAYNDMHFELLGPALEQLGAKPDAEYNMHVNNAKTLRKQAEAKARKKAYANGISDLTKSTSELTQALNHIGLSIPGQ